MSIEKELSKFLSDKGIQGAYKVIEYNSTKTYFRIGWYRADKTIILPFKEYYKGVPLSDIDTIDKTIDSSLTEIIKY